jgi:tetratricopeptide (TPR) repeat protein
MKRELMLILLLLMPCFGVLAQFDDEENLVITVHITSQFTEPSQQLTHVITLLTDSILQQRHSLPNITLQLENDPDFAYILVDIDLLADGILFVDTDPIYLLGVLPSDNLVPHMYTDFPLAAEVDDPLWLNITTSFILSLSAYLAGDCDTMAIYINQTRASVLQQQEIFFLGQIEQTNAYLTFYEAMCAMVDGDYPRAAQMLQGILDVYEQNRFDTTLYGLEVRLNLGWAFYKMGDVSTALEWINGVIGTQFDWIEIDALLMRSNLYAEVGQYEQALADIERANSLIFYEDPYFILRFAELRIAVGDYLGAEGELTQLEKSFPDWVEALYLRGMLAYAEGNSPAALDYFYAYIETDPDGLFIEQAQAYIDGIVNGS